jgi:membrane protease YdiL (CAAX protease family)
MMQFQNDPADRMPPDGGQSEKPLTTEPENQTLEGPPKRDRRLWGPWATVGLGTAVFVINSIAQAIVLFIFGIIMVVDQYSANISIDPLQLSESLSTNGDMLSTAMIVSAMAGIGFIILFVSLRKGISIQEYLGLRRISIKTITAMIGVIILLLGISIAIGLIFKTPEEPNTIADAYINSSWPALFWIGTVIFAPIFEESLFRGFIFVGLKQSIIGPIWTIILTSLVFTSLHAVQYSGSGLAASLTIIFILGLTLGIVRWKTDSLWASIFLHGCWNLLQMVTLELSLHGIG